MTDHPAAGSAVGALLMLRAAPGRGPELAELVARMVELTNREHGPVFYGAGRLVGDEEVFVVTEVWASRDDVDAHLASTSYQALNREAAERGLLVPADDSLPLRPLGASPITGLQLEPIGDTPLARD